MTLPAIGTLTSLSPLDRPDLVAPPVLAALTAWPAAGEVAVVEIDPEQADTAAMSAAYDLPMDTGANCVVIAGSRAGEERVAACVVRADTRADVNNRVRRLLDVRKASFLPMDRAVAESGMEYGGITPLGLPSEWRVLVDPRCLDIDVAIIGSGVRRSKIVLAGRLLGELPGAEVVMNWLSEGNLMAVSDDRDSGRNETPQERADRKWGDLLQELRVMQTGVQLLAGFLLTLPFQQRFGDLDEFQRDFYLVLVVLAGVTTALVLTPVAAHRTLSGRQVKERLVSTAGKIASLALGAVAVLVVGITTFIFDVVVDRTWAMVVGAAMAVVLASLLVLLPRRLITKDLV